MRRGHTRGSGIAMGATEGPLTGILKPKRPVPKAFQARQHKLKNDPTFAALEAGKVSARLRRRFHKITLPTEPFDWRKV